MKNPRFLLIVLFFTLIMGCKEFKLTPISSDSNRSAGSAGSSTEGETAQSTPAPSADRTKENEKRLAAEPAREAIRPFADPRSSLAARW